MPEVLLASHIAVLEGVSVSMEEHLEHGENFVEVVSQLIWDIDFVLSQPGQVALGLLHASAHVMARV